MSSVKFLHQTQSWGFVMLVALFSGGRNGARGWLFSGPVRYRKTQPVKA